MTFYHGNSILGAGAGFFRLHLRFRQHVAFAGDPHVQRRRQKNAQDQRHYQAAYNRMSSHSATTIGKTTGVERFNTAVSGIVGKLITLAKLIAKAEQPPFESL